MSTPILHPTLDGVLAIHAEVLTALGGSPGLHSRELLEAALAAPQAALLGTPTVSEPVEIAAAYLFFLGRNAPFVDGSQRVALATCLSFLSENGCLKSEELDAAVWENLAFEASAGILSLDEVTQKLRELVA